VLSMQLASDGRRETRKQSRWPFEAQSSEEVDMRILFITDYLPYPLISGDRIRNYNLIRRIARQHQVSLVGFLQTPDEAGGVSHLQEFCHRVEVVNLRRRRKLARVPGLLRYVLAGIPFDFEFLHSEVLANKIRQFVSTVDFDIVHIEQSRMALYLKTLPPGAPFKRILGLQNVASIQYDRISYIALTPTRRMRAWLYSRMLRRWEPCYAERFDRCITVSEVDRRLLLSANSHLQVDVVPNGVDTQIYQPLPLEGVQPALLLIGNMSYAPCVDGAIWFCSQILPHIRRKLSEVEAWVVGISPPPEVVRLSGDGVHVTGRVEDVVPYYRQSTVSVVPLRAGGGTRLKILEAMALGRPVVSTSIGCEGLDVVDGKHLLIADDPERFAEKTVRLLTDRALYQRIVAEARQLVVTRYDWDVIAGQLLDVYSKAMQ
jgi:sugar transferase (PEP-CTERM/EpsH1 system associated)